jgi:hypothetical protein
LGSAEITHPFHPLRGQCFVVLKVRRVSGIATLSLRHADFGSFGIPQEWTDFGPSLESAVTPLIIDAFGLCELAMLVDFFPHDSTRD